MHTKLILFAALLSFSSSYSQEIVVQAIGPAAGVFSQSGPSLAYTVGELVIEPTYGDSVSVGSGLVYLVDTAAITGISSVEGSDLGIVIFPNPTVNSLNVKLSDLLFEPTIELYSLNGNLLERINCKGQENVSVDFSRYASGHYLLSLKHPEHGTVASYKIQKN